VPEDLFDGNALFNGVLVTVVVALCLVLTPTWVAVPVLVVLAFACARLSGRDAGLGSVVSGSLMFGYAISEPHFVWEVESEHDVVLLIVLFVASLAASEAGARLRLHARAHH
jgi:K+-sensing histidine kinase KdpD